MAMANLGYQWLFHALADAGLAVARAVWPERAMADETERDTLRLIDDDRPAAEAEVWFVSISFENDLTNLAAMLRLAGVPVRAADRGGDDPLIVAGGVVPSLNPEPASALVDVCLLGEGRSALGPFLDYLREHDVRRRDIFLEGLKEVPAAYVGCYYHSRFEGERLVALAPRQGFPHRVQVAKEKQIDPDQNRIHLRAPGAVFGDALLIEVARGCVNRCRFCAAGHLFLPYRPAAAPAQLPDFGQRVLGLVGSNVSGHPGLDAWLDLAGEQRVSLSSIRRDTLTSAQWRRLVEGGLSSAALAPEAGSERLRRVINKPATDAQIIDEVRRAVEIGVKNLKLYFMIGLPSEEAADREAIIELVARCREAAMIGWKARGWAGKITVSANPFIPKPHTPFQWHPFGAEKTIKGWLANIVAGLRRTPNVEVQTESLRAAVLQALLAVGDRRAGELAHLVDVAGGIRPGLRAWPVDHVKALTTPRRFDEVLPWDPVDTGIRRDYLEREYDAALAERVTPQCPPDRVCRICGVCDPDNVR